MVSPLKAARIERNKTLIEVAAAVGIDSGNLSRIERGVQVPSKGLAEKLALYYEGAVTETQIFYPERFVAQAASSTI